MSLLDYVVSLLNYVWPLELVLACLRPLTYLDVPQPLCPVSKDRRMLLTLLPHTLSIGGFAATPHEHDLPICNKLRSGT